VRIGFLCTKANGHPATGRGFSRFTGVMGQASVRYKMMTSLGLHANLEPTLGR
jgi:hypothetical protein